MRELGLSSDSELRVRLVADAEMREAHLAHLGHDTTTDVLTFNYGAAPANAPDASGSLDADILVCVDEARRQAQARGLEPEREALLYIVHGLLHCLGHDDRDEASAALMHRKEDEVLRAIGVGSTFQCAPVGVPST